MQANSKKFVVAWLAIFLLATVRSTAWAQDYTSAANCYGTAQTSSGGPCVRPSMPASISLGVILVEFSNRLHYTRTPDLPNGYLKQHFENMLFSDNFYITTPQNPITSPDGEDVYGSLKDWYQENSHGLVQITGQVINPADGNGVLTWLNLGSVSSYINNEHQMILDAINNAVSLNWNCNYNVIAVIGAQAEINTPGAEYARGRAWHGSDNFGGPSVFRISASQLPSGSPYFTYGNFMGAYTGSERWEGSSSGSLATFRHIGLHGHESFHVVGFVFCGIWQDQGKLCTGFSTGDWDTMHRTDPGPKRKGECLSHISAARKISAGWAVATNITANNMAENIQYINTQTDISPTATDFYRFTDTQSGEQFIIENRQYTAFNSFLPAWWDVGAVKGGLLIFNTKPYASISSNDRSVERMQLADNGFTAPYTGGSGDPTQIWSFGDPGDPFPGSANKTSFSIATTPNSAVREILPCPPPPAVDPCQNCD